MHHRTEDFYVTIRINFDRDNASDLDRLLDILERELQADQRFHLAFRGIGKWGGPADDQINVCTPDERIDTVWRMREEARKRGLVLQGDIQHAGGIGTKVCYAARPDSFIIGATGKIMKCTVELDTNDRNVVGRIDELGHLTLDDNKMSLWTDPAFESDTNCQKCTFLPTCQGMSCPLLRWQKNESPCISERTTFKRLLRNAAGDFSG